MGKPYSSELRNIASTIKWANTLNLSNLKSLFSQSAHPTYFIGSGGSLSACYFAASLLQALGVPAKAITPLEVYGMTPIIRGSRIIFISAQGKNIDIINALKVIAPFEPISMGVISMTKGSELANICYKYSYGHVFEFPLPSGKDGFLATNSLMAYFIILYRVCALSDNLLAESITISQKELEEMKSIISSINDCTTIHVLYSWLSKAIAMDIESKATEAALVNVLVSDFRNFGHGRHHWFAKRPQSSLILILQTKTDQILAKKTVQAMPTGTPIITLNSNYNDFRAGIELLLKGFYFIGLIGEKMRIDPGRPGVPEFGRKIYNLRYYTALKSAYNPDEIPFNDAKAIKLKSGVRALDQLSSKELKFWQNNLKQFKIKISKTDFGIIIVDYDGTLCSEENRYDGITDGTSRHLSTILSKGFIIGIATGRGKSVLTDLKAAIPEEHWGSVYIGYYNGGLLGKLSDDNVKLAKNNDPDVINFTDELKKYATDLNWQIDLRPSQASIKFDINVNIETCKRLIRHIYHIGQYARKGLQILESSHSIDIISSTSSKLNLIESCKDAAGRRGLSTQFLSIGDKGEWPGNDYELLNHELALSVDEVSADFLTCWNLSKIGNRNISALEEYLSKIQFNKKSMNYHL